MARPLLIAALAAILLGLLPAAAHADRQALTVTVADGATRKPVAGTKVEVKDMQGNKLGSGTTGADGNVTITYDDERADTLYSVLVDTDAKDAAGRSTFAVSVMGGIPEHSVYIVVGTGDARPDQLLEMAKAAIAKCDKAAYDRWLAELDRRVADLEKEADDLRQRTDSLVSQNDLRETDLEGARQDVERAKKAQAKLDPAFRNEAGLRALERYEALLGLIQINKMRLDEARRVRASVPPFPKDCKKDKVGLLPGHKSCPDGSGGLLAGVLNDIFDSDLDPACETVSRRRDTDRAKNRREREERRRD